MNNWRVLTIILTVILGMVVVILGLNLHDLAVNYIKKDDIEQLVYDILHDRQTRDADVLWAQVQVQSAIICQCHPQAKCDLDEYKAYWDMRGLGLSEKWGTERGCE